MLGQVEAIYITANKRGAPRQVQEASLEAGKGIVGDRYHSLATDLLARQQPVPDNHLTLVTAEALDTFLSANTSSMGYGDFRRNLITRGIDLNPLVGKEFLVGEVRCLGVELCEPCAIIARVAHPAVLPQLVHKAGLRANILSDGEINPGAHLELA